MPQRFLRPGITASPKWESCCWQTQTFFVRLITLVDDFGRYDADPRLLRSHAFPLRDDITAEIVTKMCGELSKSGLVVFYNQDGKTYLQLTNWQERPRAEHSKYPQLDNTCEQMFSKDSKCSLPSSSSSSSSSSLDQASARNGEHGSHSFKKPTLSEAKTYGSEIGMTGGEVESWYDHFESNGWKVGGKTRMSDWKAALRNGNRRKTPSADDWKSKTKILN